MSIQRLLASTALSLVLACTIGSALVRADGLPPVPGVSGKTAQGGMTAGASVEREGGSALEPYLVTWLIPAFGLVIFAVCLVADKSVRASLR